MHKKTKKKGKTPVVNREKCIACGACIAICPNKAISFKDGKSWINPEKCRQAYECIKVCPAGAIQL